MGNQALAPESSTVKAHDSGPHLEFSSVSVAKYREGLGAEWKKLIEQVGGSEHVEYLLSVVPSLTSSIERLVKVLEKEEQKDAIHAKVKFLPWF